MTSLRGEGRSFESFLISVVLHLLLIFLLPYAEPEVLDIYPLDFEGVVELTSIDAEPPSRTAVPGAGSLVVRQEPSKPEPPRKQVPVAAPKPEAKAQIIQEPKVKTPTPVEPKIAPKVEQPVKQVQKTPEPEVDTQVVTGSSSKYVVSNPPESSLVGRTPKPEPKVEPKSETRDSSADGAVSVSNGSDKGQETASVPAPAAPTKPAYPGGDQSGAGLVRSTGGSGGRLYYPKSVQNSGSRGEAQVRVYVKPDGSFEKLVFLTALEDPKMAPEIEKWVKNHWTFAPDTVGSGGRGEAYFVDVRIAYDAYTDETKVKTERASYQQP